MDNKGLCSQSGGRLFSNHESVKQHRGRAFTFTTSIQLALGNVCASATKILPPVW